MSPSQEPPPQVRAAALHLRDECAAALTALTLETLAGLAAESGPRAVPDSRREGAIGEWRLAAATDVWRKADRAFALVCWAVADGGAALGRHTFDERMFRISPSQGLRELTKDEMATKVKD